MPRSRSHNLIYSLQGDKTLTQVSSSKVAHLKTVGITLPITLVQKARKYGLNISYIARKALIQEINRIENQKIDSRAKRDSNSQEWWGCPDLNRGPESPSLLLDWRKLRQNFLVWLESRDLAFDYKRSIISYLDRFAPQLSKPLDVVRLFDGLSAGQKHCLLFSLRNLFNFCELAGFDSGFIDSLRRALPKDTVMVDLYVPDEKSVKQSIAKLRRIPAKYKAVYRLLLESGLRLREAVRLSNEFHELYEKLEMYERFVCVPLFWSRASKKSFYAYFMHETANLLRNNGEKLSADATSKVCKRYGLVAPKYLRKFVFDKMVELGIPESVADFIQGRAPKTVGARHYMHLKRQADLYYPKYANYLEKLRKDLG
ncbi:MAG: hypothetical protein DRJ18_00150 [Candidatus Methanomethylicota archaeon]|nr:MAG: hypothetical protein DRJ18_00150 [Candidatus Verstraetearchaeota archaeon]